MSLFAHIEMAGNSQGSVSEREAYGNGPVTIIAGHDDNSLCITIQPSGNYTIEAFRGTEPSQLSFFARGDKHTVRFRRKRLTGTLKGEQ